MNIDVVWQNIFIIKCTNGNKLKNIEVQQIKQVQECNYDLKSKLWCRENFWKAELFTLSHGINSKWD